MLATVTALVVRLEAEVTRGFIWQSCNKLRRMCLALNAKAHANEDSRMSATLSITPLVVPDSLDADDAAEFIAYGRLDRLICDEATGLADLALDTAQMLQEWRDSTDAVHCGLVARRNDDIVGMVTVRYPQETDAHAAEVDLLVPRAHWGKGIERALLGRAESDALSRGRTVVQTWTLHRPLESDRMIEPRTRRGRVPANEHSDLLFSLGYEFQQIERVSEFDLRADPAPLRRALDDALTFAGSDYRVIEWTAPTPPEWRDGFASVLGRLLTDAPTGEMDFAAEKWDSARVERRDAQFAAAGQTFGVVVVQHIPTGEIVAFNELLIGADRSGLTHQYGTLVAQHHRGHRLGTIVKCANLLRWRELMPHSRAVSTFNAEENRPMLRINEALGFVAVSYSGVWQKKLEPHGAVNAAAGTVDSSGSTGS